jgi:L-ascorbate metabolism protein UlaG (beta-lactamase superfamily)
MKSNKKQKLKKMVWIALLIIAGLVIVALIFFNQRQFGSTPTGERLEHVKSSPHYSDGQFRNASETRMLTTDRGYWSVFKGFFAKKDRLHPKIALPVVKTNLHKLDKNTDMLVWFGHSSYLLQVDGIRVLVDPVFYKASPVAFYNKAFEGTNVFEPEDIPDVDYLIISHDHWDHLDYQTVTALKDRVGKVVCGLGVGAHFERWGFGNDKIVEMDWQEEYSTGEDNVSIYCLPARHFSGRGLSGNKSLWASYLISTAKHKVYIGGDSGYDTHYAEIGERFGPIDLAVLENGQYNEDWNQIHMLPESILKAYADLNAACLFTVHHSKYALAYHPWDEPLKNIASLAEQHNINLILPMMGEVVQMKDSLSYINRWWEGIE